MLVGRFWVSIVMTVKKNFVKTPPVSFLCGNSSVVGSLQFFGENNHLLLLHRFLNLKHISIYILFIYMYVFV